MPMLISLETKISEPLQKQLFVYFVGEFSSISTFFLTKISELLQKIIIYSFCKRIMLNCNILVNRLRKSWKRLRTQNFMMVLHLNRFELMSSFDNRATEFLVLTTHRRKVWLLLWKVCICYRKYSS